MRNPVFSSSRDVPTFQEVLPDSRDYRRENRSLQIPELEE